jgi:predicted MFS family arabinose efflux permease
VCAFVDLYATQPILPGLEAQFHVSKAAASLTVSATTAAVALAAPFVGLAADRLGRKRVIVPAIFLLALPTLLAATATTLPALVAWRFAQGLVLPAIFAVSIAYVTEEYAGRGVGAAMAALVTGNVIGGFTGRVVTGLVASAAGWRAAFVVLAALNVAGGFMTWRLLPPATRFTPHRTGLGAALGAMTGHLRTPALAATYAVGFSILFSLVAAFTYVTFYLSAPPFSLSTAALTGIFVVYLVGAVVTPFAGRAIDRVGSRRTLVGALGCSAAGMLLTLTHSLPAVVLGLAICCSAVFVCQSASTSYLQHAAPVATRSSAAGLYVFFYYLGGSAGGELPGLAWTAGGWPACVAMIIAAQLLTIGIALTCWGDHASRPAVR